MQFKNNYLIVRNIDPYKQINSNGVGTYFRPLNSFLFYSTVHVVIYKTNNYRIL